MRHSELLTKILALAEEIRLENGLENISAPIVVAACSDFQAQRYTGLDTYLYPERYEEERLRLAYSAIYKLHISRRSYFGKLVKKDMERLDKAFDFSKAVSVATVRGKTALSADLVFLSAVSAMESEDRACLPAYRCPLSASKMMTELDHKIYDYVIDENEKLVAELTKKIGEATALRDWKPARKFREPEDMSATFFGAMRTAYSDKKLTMQIPKFFGDGNLKLTIYCVDGVYYLHDNGSAISYLSKRVQDKEKRQRILKKVCGSQWIERGRILGSFTSYHRFFRYLQYLIFIAHGELVYTKLQRQVYPGEKGWKIADPAYAEDFDHKGLLDTLKSQIRFDYDEDQGLYLHLSTTYSLNSTTVSYLMETGCDGEIRFSDRRKGKLEGEILESLYYISDELTPFGKSISHILAPFGGYFSDGNVYLTAKQKHWYPSLFRFVNMAVLLSELGHLLKVKEK